MDARIRRLGALAVALAIGALLLPAAQASAAATFTNSAAIAIPVGSGASPYPSSITASGLAGTVTDLNLTTYGFTHSFPADVGIVLVGPGGQALELQYRVGGENPGITEPVTTTFDDQAVNDLPLATGWPSGSYKPTVGGARGTYPAPGPGTTYNRPGGSNGLGTLAGTFNGSNPNGIWKLYVNDFFPANDGGGIAGGWSLDITTSSPDVTAPHTTIQTGPSGPVNSASASFAFSADELASYECKLDTGTFTACDSPASYLSLAEGDHTFSVRATDPSANVEAPAATQSFTVDTTPPQTTIDHVPSGTVASPIAHFEFGANESATFKCRLDSAPFTTCDVHDPPTYGGLGEGQHTIQVRATDLAGNVNAVDASHTFTVDTVAPLVSIDAGPYELTNETVAGFVFSANEPATFECKLDDAAFTACRSPLEYSDLSTGEHTFVVRATDAAGNVDAVDATRTFTIVTTRPSAPADTADPVVTVTKPKVKKGKMKAAIEFTGTDNSTAASALKFTCSLDGKTAASCTSPAIYRHLKVGTHSFFVIAQDAAGNLSAPATTSFQVKPKQK